jgi:hypothetical protein
MTRMNVPAQKLTELIALGSKEQRAREKIFNEEILTDYVLSKPPVERAIEALPDYQQRDIAALVFLGRNDYATFCEARKAADDLRAGTIAAYLAEKNFSRFLFLGLQRKTSD